MFRTYILNGREYFEFGEGDALTKKDFPFPESLLRFLYLNGETYAPLVRRITDALKSHSFDDAIVALDELAQVHIYFELVRVVWRERIKRTKRVAELEQLPDLIRRTQREAKNLIDNVLLIDRQKTGIPEDLATFCYASENISEEDGIVIFRFHPLSLNYQLSDQGSVVETLYPKDIHDLIDFSLRECAKRDIWMRRCKNCHHFFALTGRSSAEYCDITTDAAGRTCKEMGAILTWRKNKKDNVTFNEYRREYKKRFAWTKTGKLSSDALYAWGAEAREKMAQCDRGEITFEEFKEWLGRL